MKMKIDGIEYEITELGMDTGFDLISEEGDLNASRLIRATVLVNGQPPERDQIPLRHAQQLLPKVMELNGMAKADEEGNVSAPAS